MSKSQIARAIMASQIVRRVGLKDSVSIATAVTLACQNGLLYILFAPPFNKASIMWDLCRDLKLTPQELVVRGADFCRPLLRHLDKDAVRVVTTELKARGLPASGVDHDLFFDVFCNMHYALSQPWKLVVAMVRSMERCLEFGRHIERMGPDAKMLDYIKNNGFLVLFDSEATLENSFLRNPFQTQKQTKSAPPADLTPLREFYRAALISFVLEPNPPLQTLLFPMLEQ